MADSVYKTIELTGTSSSSSDEAIQNAIAKAASTLHSMRWFHVVEHRGRIDGNRVAQWQVTLKVAFTLDD